MTLALMPNAAASPQTENIFPGRQHLLLREVKGIIEFLPIKMRAVNIYAE
jgi:hypothetical protein